MTETGRADGVKIAHQLVVSRFPNARAAWLGGSVAAGTATSNSDLDITVLLDGPPAPYRSSEVIDGWPVEWFVQTEQSLLDFCETDRIRRRRPTTMRLVGSSVVLADADGSGRRLQQALYEMDLDGPPVATEDELEEQRYAVTDLLDDLVATRSRDELLVVGATLLRAAGDLVLAVYRRWTGSGKWLLRELDSLDAAHDTSYARELLQGLRAVAADDPDPLRRTVIEILGLAGGPVFAGYRRGAPNRGNGGPLVEVVDGSVDEPGIIELLAFAVGDGEERLNQAVQRYREEPIGRLLVAVTEQQRPVGILGYLVTDAEATVLHVATAPNMRGTGVGTSLLMGLQRLVPAGLSIVAETDSEAVSFYRSNGFSVTSLGEKYPGVERFRVTLEPSPSS
ncbi:GNAT family N-acetyltransferase [Mycolicibacterium iranicum]|uniref:GNAT family N-acetyltransferase n=1 Tax=Mycolicibacterium iranicum TaxID=912594 RepID=A0ABT4HLL8_MYCIR|nr:GNAT family N-acetyltransferase [Mycolicibacterium iranicum]MCZ0730649.1 GNAT family N-acetyltransferase [Mycolicibacterium iranicum]